MKIVPFKPEHIAEIVVQKAQENARQWITPAVAEALVGDYAFTGLHEGTVIGCAGVVPIWEGRGLVWAYFSVDAKKHMVEITLAAKRFFQVCPFARVEAAVECDFKAGHRWIKTLGFTLESTRMKKYLPGGQDCALYARTH